MDIEEIRTIFQGREPSTIGRHQDYAVFVPFCNDPDLSILYEVRASGIRQPGEVCFPGGHVEDGETLEECAVRETCEELGVSPDDVNIIAQGDTLYGSGNFTLYTFVGELNLDITPDEKEVSDVFTVPVKVLMDAEPEHYSEKLRPEIDPDFPYEKVGINPNYPWRTSDHDIPVYDIDGRIIWGMTARITERVIEILNKFDEME